MSDKPIIFSAPMVRALLREIEAPGTGKTQTRRVIKPQPHERARGCYRRPNGSWVWVDAYRENNGTGFFGNRLDDTNFRLPYAPGDRLYVREAWTARMTHGWTIADARSRMCQEEILYRADGHDSIDGWRPSIHMPREFSRLTLTVTDVRVQRLQEISEADAVAEGGDQVQARMYPELGTCRHWFQDLWNSLHGPEAWDANPWVAAYSFTVQHGNIDMLAERAAQ